MMHRQTYIPSYRLLPVLVILFTFSISIHGQNEALKESFVIAESYLLYGEYNEALPEYLKINRADPDNNNIKYKIGLCLMQDPFQKERAIDFLLKASKDINKKYKQNNYRERSAPQEVFYYLGQAYLINDSIEKALETFRYFLDIMDTKVYDKDLVKEQIATCERALELKKHPVDFDYENLGEPVNSQFSDLHPIFSGDRTKMVYVSERRFYDAAFYSEKVDGKWQGGRMILPELGVDDDAYPTCLSYDGTTMIVYRNDEFVGNLYMSNLVDGQWTELVKLGPNINTKYWESHGTLSKDGNKLYFTSNRKGGYGGLDIYISEKQSDGTWGVPKNLGPSINTKYNEDTPFLTENEDMLFFSSVGHNNMGGYDIFYSKKQADDTWGKPVNLGFPINTTEDNLFYFPVNNGFNAYFSTYFDGGYGRQDMYYLTIYSDENPRKYKVTGTIATDEGPITSKDKIRADLIDLKNNTTLKSFAAVPGSGEFDFVLIKGNYQLQLEGEGYIDLLKDFTIDASSNKKGIIFPKPLVLKHKHIPKTFTGALSRIAIKDTLTETPLAGDTTVISLGLVENSSLTATHTVDTVEIRRDSFYIEKPDFDYEAVPEPGSNLLAFQMVEQNGDTSLTQLAFEVEKPVAPVEKTDSVNQTPLTIIPDKTEKSEIIIQDTLSREQVTPVKKDTIQKEVTEQEAESVTKKGPRNTATIFVIVFLVILLFYLRRRKSKK